MLFGNKYVEKFSVYVDRSCLRETERRERCTYTRRIIISLEFYRRTSSVYRKTTKPYGFEKSGVVSVAHTRVCNRAIIVSANNGNYCCYPLIARNLSHVFSISPGPR